MTAAQERTKMISLLKELHEKIDTLQNSIKSGGEAMKTLHREINRLKKENRGTDTFVDVNTPSEIPQSINKTRQNLFNPNDFKKSTADEDGVNDNVDPVPRMRTPFKKKKVFCGDCNKDVLIHPSLLVGRTEGQPYVCPDIKAGSCPNKN